MNCSSKEPMVEMFILENSQLVKLVGQSLDESVQAGSFEQYSDEIFRIMHVIRGNSSMMLYDNISILAHHVECIFAYIKIDKPDNICIIKIAELVSESLDFIKSEVDKIDSGKNPDGDPKVIITKIEDYLMSLNGDSNTKPWKSTAFEEKSAKPRFYIKSTKDPGDTSDKPQLVKELNLNGSGDKNEEDKPVKKDSKNVGNETLKIHKNGIFISLDKFNTLVDLINELDKNEMEEAINAESDEFPLSFFYKLTQRRRRIIKDLQYIAIAISIGL